VSRILNGEGRIVKLLNNYSRISFDFGPTLLSWLREKDLKTYQTILDADQESQSRFSGHGSAMAQAYNHMIMPLANHRDKRTQGLWGIRDFQSRFGRAPEGMWLPETAVDLETLDILAELGIRFTILAPSQAHRVRHMNERQWFDVSGGRIDPSRAYELRLASGRKLAVFFYDGPISHAVAFEDLLRSGHRLANRLMSGFNHGRAWPQIVNIATDGETYGHHQAFGDMALASALEIIQSSEAVGLTNYGEYLDRHPPAMVVEILENTAWSCAHGVERWRSDCHCSSGCRPEWNQSWRRPLRDALDWLRDTTAPMFERQGGFLFKKPWEARDEYVEIILDRSPENIAQFFSRHAPRPLSAAEQVTALQALELQRHAMLMYTSCGWFFDEISGIESVQVIQYAARVVQIAARAFGADLESDFLSRLEYARSNLPEHQDGRRIYEKFAKPAAIDLEKVAAHHVISLLFHDDSHLSRIPAYEVVREDYDRFQRGNTRLTLGRLRVTSRITRSCEMVSFCLLHFGSHEMSCAARRALDPESYRTCVSEMSVAFERSDYRDVMRIMDRHFGESSYSLKSLFRDEQRRIVDIILDSTLSDLETFSRQIYHNNASLAQFLNDIDRVLPQPLTAAAGLVLNRQLGQAIVSDTLDADRIRCLLDEMKVWHVEADIVGIAYSLEQTLDRFADNLSADPQNVELLQTLQTAVKTARTLPFKINLWEVQNVYYFLLQTTYPQALAKAL
jgi:hypothetical protein